MSNTKNILEQIIMSCIAKVSKKVFLIGLITVLTSAICSTSFAAGILKEDHPDKYVVKKGDTLWDISGLFLKSPWRWPEIWQNNSDIKNPDLIFPGDVLFLTFIDGRPVLRALKREVVKLSPSIREEDITKAIPPISPRSIAPFLNAPLVTSKEEAETAPYIVDGFNDRLITGKDDQVYARGIKETVKSKFQIFRVGRQFVHPVTKESLGLEALDIGTASLKRPGDPARIEITSSREEVAIEDRLRPTNDIGITPFFFPSSHSDKSIEGFILPVEEKSPELGNFRVIAITLGEREGVKQGHVFKILSAPVVKRDPVKPKEKYTIPAEDIGLLMVFRVFDKISYAIITDVDRPIQPGDKIVHPDYR